MSIQELEAMVYETFTFDSWQELLTSIVRETRAFQNRWLSPSAVPFFRGHASTEYQLIPSLLREYNGGYHTSSDEQNLYYEFRSRAGSLLSPNLSSWDILFLMQHHGVPTRLLDWTESLASALHFALTQARSDIDIWMLDPYLLNRQTVNVVDILDVDTSFQADYYRYFIDTVQPVGPEWDTAVAIYPRRQNPRLASQHGVFTLHSKRTALEDYDFPGLKRFRLNERGTNETRELLKVLGVHDFAMFPDLDGLSRLLRQRFPAQNSLDAALD